jgi:hypothetical protein
MSLTVLGILLVVSGLALSGAAGRRSARRRLAAAPGGFIYASSARARRVPASLAAGRLMAVAGAVLAALGSLP